MPKYLLGKRCSLVTDINGHKVSVDAVSRECPDSSFHLIELSYYSEYTIGKKNQAT